MASKKELEADKVELRKQVERAIRELYRFGSELTEIVGDRNDGEANALRILARRALFVAEELNEELRDLDVETVGLLVRFIRHQYTREATVSILFSLATKYGPELAEHADAALGAVESVASVLGGLGGETLIPGAVSGSRIGDRGYGGGYRGGYGAPVRTISGDVDVTDEDDTSEGTGTSLGGLSAEMRGTASGSVEWSGTAEGRNSGDDVERTGVEQTEEDPRRVADPRRQPLT